MFSFRQNEKETWLGEEMVAKTNGSVARFGQLRRLEKSCLSHINAFAAVVVKEAMSRYFAPSWRCTELPLN